MKPKTIPNRIGVLLLADALALAAHWTVILLSMRQRIGASYGEYRLFETLSLLRSLFAVLLVVLAGAVFFFMRRVKAWQYLAVSLGTWVGAEIAGFALAAAVYGVALREAADLLETSFSLVFGSAAILIVWALLSGGRAIARAMRKAAAVPAAEDAQSEYRHERQEREAAKQAAGAVYKSSRLLLAKNWLWLWLLCLLGVVLVFGALLPLGIKVGNNTAMILALVAATVPVSLALAVVRGPMRVVYNDEGLFFYRRHKLLGAYPFMDYRMKGHKVVHLWGGVIPLGSARSMAVTDRSGYTKLLPCRNFSDKTWVRLVDEITLWQRAMYRETEMPANAKSTGESGKPAAMEADTDTRTLRSPVPKLLPMPGEDDFISLDFAINKGQMIQVEQNRYNKILLGLLLCALGMYAAWYFLLYRTSAGPFTIENIPLFTGVFIALCFVIIPMAVMLVRFEQEKKRIPVSIRVETGRFAIGRELFVFADISDYKMTHPQGAKLGTSSHRMHLSFIHAGKRHMYTLGSGTVKNASFPDYTLLYMAFESLRAHSGKEGRPQPRQRHMTEVRVQPGPCTTATFLAPQAVPAEEGFAKGE